MAQVEIRGSRVEPELDSQGLACGLAAMELGLEFFEHEKLISAAQDD
jgi:hypothetical protein